LLLGNADLERARDVAGLASALAAATTASGLQLPRS